MKFHPYAEIFPMIDDGDFDRLADDIKQHGLREKIWTYEGQILDGRNRYLACLAAKVEPLFREYDGDDALGFVLSLNVHRRHLTDSQRAMAAAEVAKLSVGRPKIGSREPITQTRAAEVMHVGRESVKRAKKVLESGSKELQDAVKKGEVAVKKAAAVVQLPKSDQLAAAQAKTERCRGGTEQPKPLEVTPAPDFDFSDYEPEDNEAYQQSLENVMMADDKLAAMRAELDQAHREIQALKSSRDHYQSQAGEAVRLVKARDREIERLKRDLAKAKGEFVGLGAERLNS